MTPVIKDLLREKHLHEYLAFATEYRRTARRLELRTAEPPTKATYYHWLSGQLQGLPRGYHCIILEQMFPGWTAKDLFTPTDPRLPPAGALSVLGSIPPTLDPAAIAGLWCTAYIYAGARNIDLTTVTTTNAAELTATNYMPAPKTEGTATGFQNDITARLFGRHLIGQWRNSSDSYYYGTLHLAAMPGETVLDGYYTSVAADTRIEAGRWRWVRIEPQSAADTDLTTITLADPHHVYDTIFAHTDYGPPIPLTEITS